MRATAVILAGGKSQRFGQDKTVLELDGMRVVEHIARACHTFCREVLIVSNAADKFRIPQTREISDRITDAGPLGGIHAAMLEASYSTLFVTACDMPFFEPRLAELLLKQCKDYDILAPRIGDWVEPLFAAYQMSVFPCVERLLFAGRRSVRELCTYAHTGYLDCSCWCSQRGNTIGSPFYNMNFPEDYTRLLQQHS